MSARIARCTIAPARARRPQTRVVRGHCLKNAGALPYPVDGELNEQ